MKRTGAAAAIFRADPLTRLETRATKTRASTFFRVHFGDVNGMVDSAGFVFGIKKGASPKRCPGDALAPVCLLASLSSVKKNDYFKYA